MLRFTATNAVISQGFDNRAALKYSEDGNVVRFRIGERVYDKNAENNTRWVNINVKAFGNLCERIKKMQLNLFAFDRALPAPFDTLKSKRLSVSSKYGDGTASTLCASVIKGIHVVFRCMDGGEGAVGVIDHRTVAEYKSSMGPDAYHLVVYDSNSGSLMASVYDKATEVLETYTVHKTARDGAAIMMALFPVLTMDEEFSDTCSKYHDQYTAGFPDVNLAAQYMAILCDNAYRRIKDDACPAHIKVTLDRSGNIMRVGQAQLDSGALTPNRVAAGEFTMEIITYPGRGTDDGEDFEDWSLIQLRERVKLVQELDQLADAMVAEALELARTCTVETEEYFVPKTRKVLVPSA